MPPPLTLEEKIQAAKQALDTRLRSAGVSERLGHHEQGLLLRRAENATGGGAGAAGATLDDKVKAAQEALNRRLRQADVDPRQGHLEQEKLLRRAENAQGAQGGGSAPADGSAGGSAEERARLAQEALNRRLRQAGSDSGRPQGERGSGGAQGVRRGAPARPESPPRERPRGSGGSDQPDDDRAEPDRPRGPAASRRQP